MQHDYGTTNNLELSTKLPNTCEYLFVDTPNHRADQIFIRNKIPVRFLRRELSCEDAAYVIVFCRFKKKHRSRFLESMADLERSMVMEGHTNYAEFCIDLMKMLEDI